VVTLWLLHPYKPAASSENGTGCLLAVLPAGLFGIISIAILVFFLAFLYGIVALVFRYAFGIELPFARKYY
jgi:hypothetical protein